MKTRKTAAAAATQEQQVCRYRGNACKIPSGDNHIQFCDKHYKFHTDFLRNNPSILKKNQLDLLGSDTPDLTKKRKVVKKQSSILPPDEERCCRNDGMIWRCKKRRMKDKNYCKQHCTSLFLHNKNRLMMKKMKKNSGSDISKSVVAETRVSKRPGKRQLTVTDQPSTSNPSTNSDGIVDAGSVKIGSKRKKVGRMSGEPVVETRSSRRRKMSMEGGETSYQPATIDNFESDGNVGGASAEIGAEGDNVERTEGSGEPVIELESVELYKSKTSELFMELEKIKVELEKTKVELEKKKAECTEFQGKLVEMEETTKSTAEDENATEFWRKKCSDLESLVQRMENGSSTMTCVESRVPNLGSLVPCNGKESSILRCQELSCSEKVESEAPGLQYEITQTGEMQRDENTMIQPTISSDGITEGPSPNAWTKMKNVESTEGSGEPVNDQLEIVELYKSNCFKLSMEPEKNMTELEKNDVELETNKMEPEKNKMEPEKVKAELEKNAVELDTNEVELGKKNVELEKNKMEPEKNMVELEKPEMYNVELEKNEMEPEKNMVELEKPEKYNMELEKVNTEFEKNEMEPEKNMVELEKPEKYNVELEKVNAEFEKNEMEPEKNMVELEKPEKYNVELEKVNAEFEKNEMEPEKDMVELEKPEKCNVELEKVNAEFEKNEMEPEKDMVEPEKNKMELEKVKVELEENEIELEKEKVEVEKNNMEPEKNKVDLEKMKVELEKVGCTEFQDKLAEGEETRKNTSEDENAAEFWRMKCSNSEILVQRKENQNLTIGCVETHISNLVSLVPGNGIESSMLRCQELSSSEKIESEVLGLHNEITLIGEKQRDQTISKPNAVTRGEGSKDSPVHELKIEEKVMNVEEGKGWVCLEERPSQQGSSSQADLEMCEKTSVNLVSDSNDGGDSLGAEDSLGDSMDMLAIQNLNMNEDKIKWNSEAEMLSSVEEVPEVCMKAVGALYEQETPEDVIYPKGLVN